MPSARWHVARARMRPEIGARGEEHVLAACPARLTMVQMPDAVGSLSSARAILALLGAISLISATSASVPARHTRVRGSGKRHATAGAVRRSHRASRG